MKIGVRTPNLKKRVSSRTTGAINRKVKKATSPYYGQKGAGLVKDPERAIYNKVYNKTTFGADDSDGCTYGCGCIVFVAFVIIMVIFYNLLSTVL
jgi:hypothetical protein